MVAKPSDVVFALVNLYKEITGNSVASNATPIDGEIKKLAKVLKKAGSKGVVMTGINDVNAQLISLAINNALNSEVLDAENSLNIRQGSLSQVQKVVSDMKSGKVSGLFTVNIDPSYSLPNAIEFTEALSKVDLKVALSVENNETVNAMEYALPATHFLESWGDTQFSEGKFGLVQPTIQPLFKTRQVQDSLLKWSGSDSTYFDFLKNFWSTEVLAGSSWNKALHNGYFNKTTITDPSIKEVAIDIDIVATRLKKSTTASKMELNLYVKTGLGDGKQANNPWLQEFPDPITRTSWDNYLTMSMADARDLGFSNPVKDNGAINGDYAKVAVNGNEVVVPVMIQPGQAKGSVGLSLGFGKTFGLKEEMQVGVNAYPFYKDGNNLQYNVAIEKSVWNAQVCLYTGTKNNCGTS